jgi:hypothetical protein
MAGIILVLRSMVWKNSELSMKQMDYQMLTDSTYAANDAV